MKGILLFILALVASTSAYCQTADGNYTPLVREGSEWYYSPYAIEHRPYKLYIQGDSVVDGVNYKILYYCGTIQFVDSVVFDNIWQHALLREEDKKVYMIPITLNQTLNRPTGELKGVYPNETLIYDFDNVEKFYKEWYFAYGRDTTGIQFTKEYVDTNLLVQRDCYTIKMSQSHNIIEGIGAEYKNMFGDLVHRTFCITKGRAGFNLAYMKNGEGEIEYFNQDYYERMMLRSNDIDGDEKVDISDVNNMINVILGLEQETAKHFVNDDKSIDISDLNSVVNYILGKTKSSLEK